MSVIECFETVDLFLKYWDEVHLFQVMRFDVDASSGTSDWLLYDAPPFSRDELVDAFKVAIVVVVIGDNRDGCFEFASDEVVLQPNTVLPSLALSFPAPRDEPAHRERASSTIFEILRHISSYEGRVIVDEQMQFVPNCGALTD